MQVAVAGVEDVGHLQVVLARERVDAVEHVAQRRARDDRVLHVVVRGDAAHGREGGLAHLPEDLALGLVARHADLAAAGLLAQLAHLVEGRLELGLRPVELDEQRRAGVERPPGVGHGLRGADREVVHHLDGARHDPRGDDVRDRVPGVAGGLEEGHERAHRLGRGHDADGDLRRHAQRPLGADEDAAQVVAGEVELLAAQLLHGAVGQDDLKAADVVRGEAVLEAVRAAGVLGHVAADRAHDLRRRIGRVEVRGRDGGRDGHVRHPGLAHHALVLEVDLEDAAQPRQDHEHAVLERQRPARQAAARAARHPRHARRVAGAHDGGHLLAVPGSTAARGTAAYCSSPSDS
jgi:hypothetical protein